MRKSLKTHIKFQKPTFIHSKPKLTFGKKNMAATVTSQLPQR